MAIENNMKQNFKTTTRQGMSLIEVLISMFVLLFGLLGVAAIFPVGNHYVTEGEKYDFSSALAQNAFEELKGRGMLRPKLWYYSDVNDILKDETVVGDAESGVSARDSLVIQPQEINNIPNPNVGTYNITTAISSIGSGHAFVIDPMGTATLSGFDGVDLFPRATNRDDDLIYLNPWAALSGERWPVRRITLPTPDPASPMDSLFMSGNVAETIFRLRDDLVVDYPDAGDQPSKQRWDTADENDTPTDLTDDTLLRRQSKGNYSWLATIVPTFPVGLEALQPADGLYGELDYDVSVVVFRKRDLTPSTSGERLISGELLPGGELVIYDPTVSGTYNIGDSISEDDRKFVDRVTEHVRPGSWVAVMGVNPVTGQFVMKWYRMLSLSDETEFVHVENSSHGGGSNLNGVGRRAMLIGPDWPTEFDNKKTITDLRVAILPGVVSVVTKPMKMENYSLWQQQ